MTLLRNLNDEGRTIIMVTHEPDIAQHCKRMVSFRDGRIIDDELVKNRLTAKDQLARMASERTEEDRIRAVKTGASVQ
jgi:putative ABC transport system ATP-binding protein